MFEPASVDTQWWLIFYRQSFWTFPKVFILTQLIYTGVFLLTDQTPIWTFPKVPASVDKQSCLPFNRPNKHLQRFSFYLLIYNGAFLLTDHQFEHFQRFSAASVDIQWCFPPGFILRMDAFVCLQTWFWNIVNQLTTGTVCISYPIECTGRD